MTDHYFSATPDGPERRRTIRARVWGDELELVTANGVFSGDGLDLGTAVLLRESPVPTGQPRLLDLGCGYGPIAVALALGCQGAQVDAVDVNDRALGLVRRNAEAAGLGNVRACRPDEVPADVAFSGMWSNPPIRAGKEALHALLLRWLPRVQGASYLVVSKNLGSDSLARWLVAEGYPTTRLSSHAGFRVLEVRR